jgi:hypothetical protein
MILTREIDVKINESNLHYYENLGYDVSIGEIITIPIELLSKGSHHKIKCKCDNCGVEKEVIYKNYTKYKINWGEYYCRKCSEKNRIETLRKNHGVDYPIQNEKIHSKMINTIINKYGVDNISKKNKNNE